MNLPSSEPIRPEEDSNLTAARRRRRARLMFRNAPEDVRVHLAAITNLITPSIDFYIGFLLAGILAAAAILLDAPALFVLAALFTPFLGPVIGLPFSASAGSGRLLFTSLANLLIGGTLIFSLGALSGWIATYFPAGKDFLQIGFHNAFTWADMVVLVVGAGFTTFLLVRSPRQKPLVANIALAYELVLPLAVSGFGVTSGIGGGWILGLNVFLVHLAIAAAIAAILLFVLGLKPQSVFGYALCTTLIILAGLAVWGATGTAGQVPISASGPLPQLTAVQTTQAPLPGTATPQPGQSVQPGEATFTPTDTVTPSLTPTPTVTFAPTPVWAKIDAPSGGGAFIREEPGGKIVTSLVNGSPVIVISEPIRVQGGAIWVKIRTEDGVVGWILQSLLATATPSPGW